MKLNSLTAKAYTVPLAPCETPIIIHQIASS